METLKTKSRWRSQSPTGRSWRSRSPSSQRWRSRSPTAKLSAVGTPPPPPPPPSPPVSRSRSDGRTKPNATELRNKSRMSSSKWKKDQTSDQRIPRSPQKNNSLIAPPPPPPPGEPRRRKNKQRTTPGSTPQLVQQQNQWNAEKDIPQGLVSSSPFSSRPTSGVKNNNNSKGKVVGNDSSAVEAQKKQQWDAERDIPKGLVKEKAQDAVWSPRSSESGINNNTSDKSSGNGKIPRREGSTNKHTFFPDDEILSEKRPQLAQQKSQWEPQKDIPRGKVKGMSNIFGGKLSSKKSSGGDTTVSSSTVGSMEIPSVNHIEPVEPSEPSPSGSTPTKIVKPIAMIPASKSEDELELIRQSVDGNSSEVVKPPQDKKRIITVDTNASTAGESDPWVVPSTTAEQFFGSTSWGESPSVESQSKKSQFNDDDWFQGGSIATTTKDEKRIVVTSDEMSNNLSSITNKKSESSEGKSVVSSSSHEDRKQQQEGAAVVSQDDDNDEPQEIINAPLMATSGSFAAAIQPPSRTIISKPPATIREEDEIISIKDGGDIEEDAVTVKRSPNRTPRVQEDEPFLDNTENNSNKNGGFEITRTNSFGSKASKVSKKSIGSKMSRKGFSFRKNKVPSGDASTHRQAMLQDDAKSSSKNYNSMEEETGGKKRRGGLFKIFSKKEKKANSSGASIVSRSGGRRNKGKKKDDNSLRGVFEDSEKERSRGIINTRDDASVVSEMTNPTVFQAKTPTNEPKNNNSSKTPINESSQLKSPRNELSKNLSLWKSPSNESLTSSNETRKQNNFLFPEDTGMPLEPPLIERPLLTIIDDPSKTSKDSENSGIAASVITATITSSGTLSANPESNNDHSEESNAIVKPMDEKINIANDTSEPDPFDVNSGVFSAGDPFAPFASDDKLSNSKDENPAEDLFSDNFFAGATSEKVPFDETGNQEDPTMVELRTASMSPERFFEQPMKSKSQVSLQTLKATPSVGDEMTKIMDLYRTVTTELTETQSSQGQSVTSSQTEKTEARSMTENKQSLEGISAAMPDPDILLLSSDDEAENDNPVTASTPTSQDRRSLSETFSENLQKFAQAETASSPMHGSKSSITSGSPLHGSKSSITSDVQVRSDTRRSRLTRRAVKKLSQSPARKRRLSPSPVRTQQVSDSPARTQMISNSPGRSRVSQSPVRSPRVSQSPARSHRVSESPVRTQRRQNRRGFPTEDAKQVGVFDEKDGLPLPRPSRLIPPKFDGSTTQEKTTALQSRARMVKPTQLSGRTTNPAIKTRVTSFDFESSNAVFAEKKRPESFSKLVSENVGSNLSQKMISKRQEKRMQQDDSNEIENEAETKPASTSAYLKRFKTKVSNHKKDDESINPFNSTSMDSRSMPVRGMTQLSRSSRRVHRMRKTDEVVDDSEISSQINATKGTLMSIAARKSRSNLKKPQPGVSNRVSSMRAPSPVPAFEFEDVADPMQRAGLRLLAAAVIPIQSEMRRFLAKSRALNTMFAIIVIQASIRKWLVWQEIDRKDFAALIIQKGFANHVTREYARALIQAHVRGWLVRKAMTEQMSAILIQAHIRRWIVERKLRKLFATTLIQSTARMWSARRQHLKHIGALRMQCVVRKWIARSSFVTQISAVRIQAAFRGYKAFNSYWQYLVASIQIQATFRGWLARDRYEDKHYCATQIQKIFRGYMSTMNVYGDIYKITLIQSVVRKKIAMDNSTYKMAFIIQMQSIFRGYLFRKYLSNLNAKATLVQASFRGFSARLNYQFILVDIILIQNLIRQRKAKAQLEQLKNDRLVGSATIIQSQWRSYDCSMNYLHYLAHVLTIQSVIRRWKGNNYVKQCREDRRKRSAITMQKYMRGFISYKRYTKYLAATSIQKSWRRHYHQNNYTRYIGAKTFQKAWRGHVDFNKYKQFKSAKSIQKSWRGRVALSSYKNYMSAKSIQKIWRGHAMHKRHTQYIAARNIQRVWKGYFHKTYFTRYLAARSIQKVWRRHVNYVRYTNYIAARCIQKVWRGHVSQNKYTQVLASIVIQRIRRGVVAKTMYKNNLAAICVQKSWRGFSCHNNYKRNQAATLIQKSWRGYFCFADYMFTIADIVIAQAKIRCWVARRKRIFMVNNRDTNSATVLQRNFRGYAAKIKCEARAKSIISIQSCIRQALAASRYHQYQLEQHSAQLIQFRWIDYLVRKEQGEAVLLIQRMSRGSNQRRKFSIALSEHRAASKIQSAWRGFWMFTNYIIMLDSAIVCQSVARSYLVQKDLSHKAKMAIRIQGAARSQFARRTMSCLATVKALMSSGKAISNQSVDAATVIQLMVRAYHARDKLMLHLGARKIQTQWRKFGPHKNFREYRSSIRIQTWWRRLKSYVAYKQFRSALQIQCAWRTSCARQMYKTNKSARDIQTVWRSRKLSKHYKQYVSARKIQALWKRNLVRGQYIRYISARRIQMAWRVEKARGQLERHKFAKKIQNSWRKKSACDVLQSHLSARTIQTMWRARTLRATFLKYVFARRLQSAWRKHHAQSQYTAFIASRKIQTLWRTSLALSRFNTYKAARNIQATWRGSIILLEYKRYMAARKIQGTWRMSSARKNFKHYSGAKKLQSLWRSHQVRKKYVQYLERKEAATIIQSSWRLFVSYTDYIFTLADIITVQRVARGYINCKYVGKIREERKQQVAKYLELQSNAIHVQRIVRGMQAKKRYVLEKKALQIQSFYRGYLVRYDVELIKRYLATTRLQNCAATVIQACWRGHDQMQKYWYCLGCVIQIQCVMRGASVRMRCTNDFYKIVVVQSIIRRHLANGVFKQKKYVAMVLAAAKWLKFEKDRAARIIQKWYRWILEERKRNPAAAKIQSIYRMNQAKAIREVRAERRCKIEDPAATKIQSIFRMVHGMVLVEIKAEKKRRRALRKKAKRNPENMLDAAWENVTVVTNKSRKSKVTTNANKQPSHNKLYLNPNDFLAEDESVRKLLTPSNYGLGEVVVPLQMMNRFLNDESDAVSEVSCLTTPTVFRPPTSRKDSMNHEAMTADLDLEEAWVDMEIHNIKEKRKVRNLVKSMKAQKLRNRFSSN